jgi:hypothetical protein
MVSALCSGAFEKEKRTKDMGRNPFHGEMGDAVKNAFLKL